LKLIIVSGRSGSGKSTALHVLEDLGYYCIDNLPIGLLSPLTREALNSSQARQHIAVSIDARNLSDDIANFEALYSQLQHPDLSLEIIYLDAADQMLIQRFHTTRRKHPSARRNAPRPRPSRMKRRSLTPSPASRTCRSTPRSGPCTSFGRWFVNGLPDAVCNRWRC